MNKGSCLVSFAPAVFLALFQVPGTHRWGKDFISVPTPRAVKGDVLKMIALSEGTRIEFISESRTRQIIIGSKCSVLSSM